MELTENNFADLISKLTKEQKVEFYETLAHNLTIVCRSIWSDEKLNENEKVESMKWLNEIMHRVIAKIKTERTASNEWKESDVIGMIKEYINKSPNIGGDVAWAIKASYRKN